MSGLYPNFRPSGVRKAWDHSSMGREGSGIVMREYGVPQNYGEPTEAVAWFADERLRVLVADYANDRRVTLRIAPDGHYTMTFERQPLASAMSAGTAETQSGSGPQDRQRDPKGDAHA